MNDQLTQVSSNGLRLQTIVPSSINPNRHFIGYRDMFV
jgi:hypothetical protein